MKQSIILPVMLPRDRVVERIASALLALPIEQGWRVEIHEHKSTRSSQQNRLLWSLYDQIIKKGGEAMQGWGREDLHEFFLIHHFGSETRTLFGKKRLTPVRRSSRLSKKEFSDFVDAIDRFMAERGLVLEMPNEMEMR
jgi:hypothetical protein